MKECGNAELDLLVFTAIPLLSKSRKHDIYPLAAGDAVLILVGLYLGAIGWVAISHVSRPVVANIIAGLLGESALIDLTVLSSALKTILPSGAVDSFGAHFGGIDPGHHRMGSNCVRARKLCWPTWYLCCSEEGH